MRRSPIAVALLLSLSALAWSQRIDLATVEAAEQFRTGLRTFHRGAYQSAILSFERSLSLVPDDRLVLEWLAAANYQAGYVDAAVRTWRDLAGSVADSASTGAAVKSRLQYATWRHGLGAELAPEPRWVLSYQIQARRGEGSAFQRPVSVRALRDGTLVVASLAGSSLSVLDVNGTLLRTLRGGLRGLDRPFDVLETPDGFAVSEFGGRRVVRLTSAGARASVYGQEAGAPPLLGPQFLAADARGSLYVTDWGANKVHKYDSEGRYLLSFRAELRAPTGIAVSGDSIYVAERGAGLVSVFDDSGNLVRALGDGVLRAPEGIDFWDERTLLVVDGQRLMAGNVELDAWSEWNDLSAVARRPTSVTVDAGGSIYVSDMDADAIHVLTRQPNLVVGNNVWIGRIASDAWPRVTVEVAVTDRFGRPLTGLTQSNFRLTEANAAVRSPSLSRTPADRVDLDVVVVVDQSPGAAAFLGPVRSTLLELYDGLSGGGRLSFVAGEVPAVVAPPGTTRLRAAEAVMRSSPSPRWSLDTALRVAVNELAGSWNRKAVIYLTAGGTGRAAFEAISLAEAAAALSNNYMSFSVVSVGDGPIAPELSYLVRWTGGVVTSAGSPRGVAGLGRELGSTAWPLYLLSYTSASFSDFGRRYLPLKVEVVLPGSSGGDISGYVAPVER